MEEDKINTLAKETNAMYIKHEILIQDRGDVKNIDDSFSNMEDQHGELFYDASDELDEYQEQDPVVIQFKDGRSGSSKQFSKGVERRKKAKSN